MRDVTTPEQRRIRDALVATGKQTPDQATAGVLADFCCEYCGVNFLDPKHPEDGITLFCAPKMAPTMSTISYAHVGSAIQIARSPTAYSRRRKWIAQHGEFIGSHAYRR
jgi:hypothetical protein